MAVPAVGLLLALSMAATASAVANGTPAPTGRYSFAVKLTMTDIPRLDGSRYNSACSAALIAPSWIITAGHCFHDVHRSPVSGPVPYATTATIGQTDDRDPGGHVVAVVEDFQSPSNDIALARLASPVFDVAPVELGIAVPRVREILRIAGWGSRTSANPTLATHLQTGQVKISSVTDTTVGVVGYAPQPKTSACRYDSGAPYFLEPPSGAPVLVSVESGGPNCPHSMLETTSRVDSVLPWIHATIRRAPRGFAEPSQALTSSAGGSAPLFREPRVSAASLRTRRYSLSTSPASRPVGAARMVRGVASGGSDGNGHGRVSRDSHSDRRRGGADCPRP